jgi:hypothetical protein
MGSLIHGKAAACAAITWSFKHTSDWYPRVSETETQLGYLWWSCTCRYWVCSRLWLKFWHNWDLQSSSDLCSWIAVRSTLGSCNSLWTPNNKSGMHQQQQKASETHVPHFIMHFSFGLLHSQHVFFGLESEDTVHTDCHLSRHFTYRCRRPIRLTLCYCLKLYLIGMWRR